MPQLVDSSQVSGCSRSVALSNGVSHFSGFNIDRLGARPEPDSVETGS
jgi:hypothetical protein